MVVGEEQQAERDLRDEQRLRECEQLRDGRPGPARRRAQNAAAEASDADPDQEECVHVVRR